MSPTIVDLTASSPAATRLSEELRIKNVLIATITDAEPERLRATLQEICNSSPEAFRIAKSLLLVPEEQVKYKTIDRKNRTDDDADQDDEEEDEEDSSEPSDSEDDTENSDDTDGEDGDGGDEEEQEDGPRVPPNGVAVIPTSGVKRLRSRFATCTNCSEKFDVTDNGKYSCVWHPGEREPDYESSTWWDHDENCHGRISDLEDEYPEGFKYNCCERLGTSEGCRIGTHVENDTSYKRARF